MGYWISYFAGVLCGITIVYVWMRSVKMTDKGTRRYNNGYVDGYHKGRAAEKLKWIPVSERLPKKLDHTEDMVLVCDADGHIRFSTYMNGRWWWGQPIAWMHVPNPYKGE